MHAPGPPPGSDVVGVYNATARSEIIPAHFLQTPSVDCNVYKGHDRSVQVFDESVPWSWNLLCGRSSSPSIIAPISHRCHPSCPPPQQAGAPQYPSTCVQPRKSYKIRFLARSTSKAAECLASAGCRMMTTLGKAEVRRVKKWAHGLLLTYVMF